MGQKPSINYLSQDLENIIEDAIDIDLLELNTCMPAIVTKYDASTQTCSVQPVFKRNTINGEVSSRGVIEDVPVVFPRSGSFGFTFPLTVGDSVLIVFSQRSLDDWVDNGGEVELTDYRLHDLTDAIAIPGLFSLSDKLDPSPATDSTEIRGEKIMLGKSGASDEPMVLGTTLQANLEDLVKAIEDFVAFFQFGQVIGAGSGSITSAVVTTPIETALASVKSALPTQNSDFIFGEKS
jgi:hypothetical protein